MEPLCTNYVKEKNPIELLVRDIIIEHNSYLAQSERANTAIEKSIAVLKMKSYELQAQTEIAQKYFDLQIKERERLFKSAMQVLDKAISNGNSELAEIAVRVIETVHGKSPFSF